MENQREIEVQDTAPSVHTTTIIREKRGSGGAVIGVIAVVALLVAGFIYMRGQDSGIIRDAAIADAAQEVGASAQQAGDAIENAANKVAGE